MLWAGLPTNYAQMSWLYESQIITEIPEEYAGFVYVITNKLTGRKYIGKKLSKFSKTTYRTERLKNGKKKRRKIRGKVESDWQTYWGSSPELSRDVEQLGAENFTREILYYCRSKAECSYIEAREQFRLKVLESDDYYNGHIQVRVHGSHIKGKVN
jgi:hypothetical protein